MDLRVTPAPSLLRSPHWSDAWLGRPFLSGTFECWDLVAAARVALGHARPDDARWAARARGASRRRRAALLVLAAHEARIARKLAPGEAPAEGDGLTMAEGGARRASHCGLLVALRPDRPPAHVLHCLPDIGVVRHRLDALATVRLEARERWRFRA